MKQIKLKVGTVLLGLSMILAACAGQIPASPLSATPIPTATPLPTPPQVETKSSTNDIIDTTDLVAHYPFNGSTQDVSGQENHGTLSGGTFVADRFGQPESAFALDGVDDFIEVDGAKSLNMVFDMSISLWFYHQNQDSQTWYTLAEKSDPERDGHSRYGMWLIRDLVEVCIQPADISLPQRCLDSEIPLAPEQWHHLVGLSDGRFLHVYINGQLAGKKDFVSRTNISQSNFELFIGTDLYNHSVIYTKGIIDDLRLYKRVLSSEEISTLYAAEK
ncbi:MAG: LamG domain-containing protein [Chloroflexota bacterium]